MVQREQSICVSHPPACASTICIEIIRGWCFRGSLASIHGEAQIPHALASWSFNFLLIPTMYLEVVTAGKEEEPVLARLLELYAHDLSDVARLKIGADGRFGYGPLNQYWTDGRRHPYLVRIDGELAGFVLVQQGSQLTGQPDVWDV